MQTVRNKEQTMQPLQQSNTTHVLKHDVVIVGGGSAGIAVASSLLARSPYLNLVIIDPAETHYYQPGWTMVGGGIFKVESTGRAMSDVIPVGANWIKQAVAAFEPEKIS
jgi:sulfide:quinone oxidoreductase